MKRTLLIATLALAACHSQGPQGSPVDAGGPDATVDASAPPKFGAERYTNTCQGLLTQAQTRLDAGSADILYATLSSCVPDAGTFTVRVDNELEMGSGLGDGGKDLELVFRGDGAGGFGVRVVNAGEFDVAGGVEFGINAGVMLTERAGAENGDFDFCHAQSLPVNRAAENENSSRGVDCRF